MYRFAALDGLRGWLAWVVVMHHLVYFTGLRERFPSLRFLFAWGDRSVLIFVMLSGFVITHLIVLKKEPYRFYLARRALRIYPIYVVALVAGIFSTFLTNEIFLTRDGLAASAQTAFLYPQIPELVRDLRSLDGDGFLEQLGLHLAMLHGVVPGSVLADAPFIFLSPAWSLSLEWQFYLVAPIVVGLARGRLSSIGLALGACALHALYRRHVFGFFPLPSTLPAAVPYFAVGIASRLLLAREKAGGSWVAAVIVGAWYLHVRAPIGPLCIWCAVLAGSCWRPGRHAAGRAIGAAFAAVFDSRLARHLGRPSYSTYLLHMPLLQLAMFLSVRIFRFDTLQANVFTVVVTLAATYLASQAAYRWIELPGIATGKSFAPRVAGLQGPAA